MPQLQVPLFPSETVYINQYLGFVQKDNVVWYFNGSMPLFHHAQDDLRSFKMFVCQLYVNGNAKQSEIARAFGVTNCSVKRWVKKFREGGNDVFFKSRTPRKATVMTSDKISEIQDYLDSGMSVPDISKIVKIKQGTISKAIQKNKLHKKKLKIRNYPPKVND